MYKFIIILIYCFLIADEHYKKTENGPSSSSTKSTSSMPVISGDDPSLAFVLGHGSNVSFYCLIINTVSIFKFFNKLINKFNVLAFSNEV